MVRQGGRAWWLTAAHARARVSPPRVRATWRWMRHGSLISIAVEISACFRAVLHTAAF